MPEPVETKPPGVTLRDFEDFDAERNEIFSGALNAMGKAFPISYGGVRLEVDNLGYEDPEHYDLARQKAGLLKDERLGRRMRGDVVLRDEASGNELERSRMTLMKVPYLTERGTFIRDGNEYVHIKQLRLLPGVYTRRKQNGELETQFNVRPGTGNNFRVSFQPDTSQYRLQAQGSDLHLYSLLKDLGVSDEELEKRWGKDILDMNSDRYDTRVLDKAYDRLVPKWKKAQGELSREDKQKMVVEALDAAQVHARIARRNLPNLFGGTFRPKRASVAVDPLPPEQPPSLKWAGFRVPELRVLAEYLNREYSANISAPSAEELAHNMVQFLSTDPRVSEEVFLKAAQQLAVPEEPEARVYEVHEKAAANAAGTGPAGCLLLRMPLDFAAECVAWGEEFVAEDQLADDGRERDVHVTAAFGFASDVTEDEIRAALKEWGGTKIRLRTQTLSRFKAKNFDVLKLGVESADLRELYRFLRRIFGARLKTSFPAYSPHITITYVKPGSLTALDGNGRLAGRVVVSSTLVYSREKRTKQTIIHLEETP